MISSTCTYRLINQQIARSELTNPGAMVRWMVAMQAQEYAMAKWAIGLRLHDSRDQDIEAAFTNGSILRTHIMRPTWHFVSPEDIRWMIRLTAPRVHQANAFTYRQMELDPETLVKCTNIIERTLAGGKHLSRTAINAGLKANGILAEGVRLSAIMMYAELEAVICSGPREAKQFTYALLEERVPPVKSLDRAEALAKLSNQYFKSRGPASLKDFITWSGLTVKEAKEGIAMLDGTFIYEKFDGKEYIVDPRCDKLDKTDQTTFLMPDYDEYGMSYKDRSAINRHNNDVAISRGNPIFNRMLILNGTIAGTWTRINKGKSVNVTVYPFKTLNKTEAAAVDKAIRRFARFAGDLNQKK